MMKKFPEFAASCGHGRPAIRDGIFPGNGTSILDQGSFDFYVVSEHGIKFKPNTPQDRWLGVVEQLTKMFESSHRLHIRVMFLLGDALTYGEVTYGEEYAQAIDMTRKVMQLSEKSIKNAAWICSSIPPSIRRETLTFAHHEAVAALPESEQSQFLDQAESENLTVSGLKKAIKAVHPTTSRGKQRKGSNADLKSEEGLQIACEKAGEWLAANEKGMNAAQLNRWKKPLEPLFKFYRRKWQSGHKR
jgi:hypothetical protein